MLKVTVCKGLPASGKSTWAIKQVTHNPNGVKRINKDLLREMLDADQFTGKSEKFIVKVRNELLMMALREGKHVIIDDTNLNPSHETRIRQLVEGFNKEGEMKAEVVVREFPIDIDEAIARDLKRSRSVGEKVIRGMYDMYLRPATYVKPRDPKLQDCIIVDIDGTIAEMEGRSPYDWARVGEDKPVQVILDLINSYCSIYHPKIVFLSGRDAVCYDLTYNWLVENYGMPFELYMRPKEDQRKDSVVKEELYRENIEGKYNVNFVVDDRQQVVDMWREIGLCCIQVAEGNF